MGLKVLAAKLKQMRVYLEKVATGKQAYNQQVIDNYQDIFNLLPNLKLEQMVKSFSVKSNDYMYVMYVSGLIRSILSLHDLINNKINNKEEEIKREKRIKQEEEDKRKKDEEAKAKKEKDDKEKKDKEAELKKSSSSMEVDAEDKASVVASSIGGFADGANASVIATPGTTIVGSTADSIAPSDLASDMMDVDDQALTKEAVAKNDDKKEAGEKKEGDAEEKKDGEEDKKEPEPTEEILNNPCRVLPSQKQFISFPAEIDGKASRYVPLLGEKRRAGFLLLRDQRPEEPEDVFLEDEKKEDDDEKEPDPPEPFEWTDGM